MFASDGNLFLPIGDRSDSPPWDVAQRLDTHLGKVLGKAGVRMRRSVDARNIEMTENSSRGRTISLAARPLTDGNVVALTAGRVHR